MTPYYQDDHVTIYHGDCREVLPTLGRFDLVLTDPPYGKVKGGFDHKWTNRPSMLRDCVGWRDVIVDAMKPNATLYWFAWPALAGRIEALIAERLNLLAHIVWKRKDGWWRKSRESDLRAPVPATERIIMAEHYGADNMALGESGYQAKCDELRGFVFEPLRSYLHAEWTRAGLSKRDAEEATGTQMAGHWFTQSQWALPTAEHYATLQRRANQCGQIEYLRREYEYLRREYEDLRREYEDLRREYEDLRRYFAMSAGEPKTDVWEFAGNKERTGHPTTKPRAMMAYMIKLSCRPSGVVADPFMGSGTTLRAAKDLGRKAIGIEIEERYCEIAARRMAQEVLPLQ